MMSPHSHTHHSTQQTTRPGAFCRAPKVAVTPYTPPNRDTRERPETTPGWTHKPTDGVDLQSPVRHIHHLRLGSRDYIYVGREDGQVELLNRNGSPRAQTPVRVHASHLPVFRKGSGLDNTSVLFIDATQHVREFTLGQGAEVGISGLTRAERLEWRDVDGDGVDDLITTWKGESTAWDARNNPISLPGRPD